MLRFAKASLAATVVLAAVGTTGPPAAAQSSTTVVGPGESIQAALDAASPGAKVQVQPGRYRESLTVTKPVTLRGEGRVVLTPPPGAPTNLCTLDPDAPDGAMPGICVVGEVTDPSIMLPPVVRPVADVRLSGLTIKGFSLAGVEAYGADRLTVRRTNTSDNPGGGVFADKTNGMVIRQLRTGDNGGRGIDLQDQNTRFAISDSTITDNQGEGIFVGGSSHGVVARNRISGNCAGLLVLDTAQPGSDGVSAITVRHNRVNTNRRFCAGDDGGRPSLSGIGVALVGARNSTVSHNRIRGNVGSADPETGTPAQVSLGGLALLDASGFTGGAAPSDNTITHNVLTGNAPFDVLYDASGSANRFEHNICTTATPPGVCRAHH